MAERDQYETGQTLAMPTRCEEPDVPLKLTLQPGGYSVELTKPDVLVGRHSEADMRLPIADVSRRHCRFVFTTEGWQLIDLGSMNGVHVNDKRTERAILHHNDLVRIGSCVFLVELAASPARRAS